MRNMKLLQAILLVFFQAAAIRTQSCPGDNPFRQVYKTRGMVGLTTPLKVITHCKPEWSTYGTCCEVQSMIKLATEDSSLILKAVDNLILESNLFRAKFVDFWQQFRAGVALPNETWVNAGISAENTPRQMIVANWKVKQLLSIYREYGLMNTTKFQTLQTSIRTCWNYMIKIRGASVCESCSSRGSSFFYDNKAYAGDKACDAIIEQCYDSIRFTFLHIRLWRASFHIRDIARLHGIEHNVENKTNDIVSEFLRFTADKVASDMLGKQRDFKSAIAQPGADRVRFCEKFVNLANVPFIVSFDGRIRHEGDWKFTFTDKYLSVIKGKPPTAAQLAEADKFIVDTILSYDKITLEMLDRQLTTGSNWELIPPTAPFNYTSDSLWSGTVTITDGNSTNIAAMPTNVQPLNLSLLFP